MFSVDVVITTTHSALHKHFKDKTIFVEVIDALLGIARASSDSDRKHAAHHTEGYFIEDEKLWLLWI